MKKLTQDQRFCLAGFAEHDVRFIGLMAAEDGGTYVLKNVSLPDGRELWVSIYKTPRQFNEIVEIYDVISEGHYSSHKMMRKEVSTLVRNNFVASGEIFVVDNEEEMGVDVVDTGEFSSMLDSLPKGMTFGFIPGKNKHLTTNVLRLHPSAGTDFYEPYGVLPIPYEYIKGWAEQGLLGLRRADLPLNASAIGSDSYNAADGVQYIS